MLQTAHKVTCGHIQEGQTMVTLDPVWCYLTVFLFRPNHETMLNRQLSSRRSYDVLCLDSQKISSSSNMCLNP